nr:phytoene desaturase family protein [uncultured Lichenicoccus sp.]
MSRAVSIIGAGPGGLASAMLLANAGADVTVYERHAQVGGRSGTIEGASAHGRFHFDIGPTFFLYPRILSDIFAECGRSLEDSVELIRLGSHYDLLFENGPRITATSDIEALQRSVATISAKDAAAIPAFLADNRAKLEAFRPVLQRPFESWRDLLRPDMLRALPLLRPGRSVDRDLKTFFSDPRVRLGFSFQSKYLGMSPYRCPSLFTILAFMEYEFGIFHPRGGTGAVMRAMADAARQMGVRFRMGEPVRELLIEGRRVTGLRTDRGVQKSDAVVLNADFLASMTNLVPDAKRRKWSNRRIARKQLSCSTFMLYLGIRGTLPDVAHHTIFLSREYEQNFREINEGRIAPQVPSFYMQNACVTDPALAPPGCSTLYVLVPVGHTREGGLEWDAAQRARYRALALQRLMQAGLPDIENRILFEKTVTPADWESELDVHRGAVFNLAHSLTQMLNFRPHNRFEDLDGVYLVGGGTHPGSGLPVIFEGARISARLLAEDIGLRQVRTDMTWSDRPAPASTVDAMVERNSL